MEVRAVGEKTMAGKMAEDMKEKEPDSPLQVKLSKLAHQISNFGYVGSIVIALAYLAHYIVLAGGISASMLLDKMALITAKSMAGSLTFSPPAMFRNTSFRVQR